MTARVAIDGLGRIGRATSRLLHHSPEFGLVAANDEALRYGNERGDAAQRVREAIRQASS